jgi:predicted dehydrogenase
MSQHVWLIGAGYMAVEYAKVLGGLGTEFTVIGRSATSAESFEKKTGIHALTGGAERHIDRSKEIPPFAIVSVGVKELGSVTMDLIEYGVKKILVEKPGALNREQLEEVARAAQAANASVWVAYNRRFYASVIEAKRIVEEDGGVTSFCFEFTEWSHEIENLDKPREVLESWFIANSTHVADMAFFLGGFPERISCYTAGSLPWHPSSCVFSGAGISKTGALFSYQANWDGPGRWGVEVCTKAHRLIFRPLEKLQIQNRGSVSVDSVEIDDSLDKEYKPGLYRQVDMFLSGRYEDLCTIDEQVETADIYNRMAHY